jgi:hypothetical protein
VYGNGETLETRNRRGARRDWLRGDEFEPGLRQLADRLPNLREGSVPLDEREAWRFEG